MDYEDLFELAFEKEVRAMEAIVPRSLDSCTCGGTYYFTDNYLTCTKCGEVASEMVQFDDSNEFRGEMTDGGFVFIYENNKKNSFTCVTCGHRARKETCRHGGPSNDAKFFSQAWREGCQMESRGKSSAQMQRLIAINRHSKPVKYFIRV